MTTKPYFCCDPALIFFASAEEARGAALHAIERATDGDWYPEDFGICWGRVYESADVADLHEHGRGSACVGAGANGLCSAGVPVDADFGGQVTLHPHPVPDDEPLQARLSAAEAEVARLTAALREAERRVGGGR